MSKEAKYPHNFQLAYPNDLTVEGVIDAVREDDNLELVDIDRFTNRAVILAKSKSAVRQGDVGSLQIVLRHTNLTTTFVSETKLAGINKDGIKKFLKNVT